MPEKDFILIADGDEDFVSLMRLAMERARITTPLVAVHSGLDLMEYLQTLHELPARPPPQAPSLILLDAYTRLLTGYQVLGWIRKQPKFSHLPVVILTGSELESQDMRARKLGANDYLYKPFSIEALTDLVRHLHDHYIQPYRTLQPKAA